MAAPVEVRPILEPTLPNNEVALLVFKPSGVSAKTKNNHLLVDVVTKWIVLSGLTIESNWQKRLTEQEVHMLYPILDKPDPVHNDGWQNLVVTHMCEEPVLVFLVSGRNVEERLHGVKKLSRRKFAPDDSMPSRVVKNFMHVVDGEEFHVSHRTLLPLEQDIPEEYSSYSLRARRLVSLVAV
jgi:hypothetical protein